MNISNQWKPIEDLMPNWHSMESSELASLAPIWKERSKKLENTEAFSEFTNKIKRKWAIETGIIEGLYWIDRGITQLLIERGIEASLMPHGSTDKSSEEIVLVLRDQEQVLEGLFDFIANRRKLSNSYIKEIHASLTRNQHTVDAINGLGRMVQVDLIRGEWKNLPNNPTRQDGSIHKYCPPEHVSSEMDRLITLHQEHENAQVPPEIEAAWLHHRFSQIHPFQDGNGRVARVLASLVFLRAGWFPLVIDRDNREQYITALEKEDFTDLEPLVEIFSTLQKKSFVAALSISEDVFYKHIPMHQLVRSAAERLRARFEGKRKEQHKVFKISKELEISTEKKLIEVEQEVRSVISTINSDFQCSVYQNSPSNDYWFNRDVIEIAKSLNYFADTRTYRSWIRFQIKEYRQTDIIVSFHALGREFVGVCAATALIKFRDSDQDGESTPEAPIKICDTVFQFSYNEDLNVVKARYNSWFEDVLFAGLDQWRQQI